MINIFYASCLPNNSIVGALDDSVRDDLFVEDSDIDIEEPEEDPSEVDLNKVPKCSKRTLHHLTESYHRRMAIID